MKSKLKILIILIFIISLTGCTQIMKDKDNKIVKYDATGQNLTKNILCKPTNKEVIDLYKDNNVNLENLPACDKFNVTTGGYEGLWTTFFVKPLAYFILKLGKFIGNYGLALILSGLFIRLLVNPITKKSALQSENIKKARPELEAIEKKYKDKQNQEETMKKTQEIMQVYKKYSVNPLSGCLFGIIQLPLFFAFLEAINRVPAIFESKFLTIQLGTTPSVGLLQQGNILYAVLVILIVLSTYYSFKLTAAYSSKEQESQMKIMSIVMMVFIGFASFGFASAISLYWITTSIVTIVQNIMVKREVH